MDEAAEFSPDEESIQENKPTTAEDKPSVQEDTNIPSPSRENAPISPPDSVKEKRY